MREIVHGGRTLALASGRIRVAAPGGSAALVWERPASVLVSEEGRRRRLPIADVTRRIQWLLLGVGLAAGLVLRLRARRAGGRKGRRQ